MRNHIHLPIFLFLSVAFLSPAARAEVSSVIPVPSLCHRIQTVTPERIDIASPETPCGDAEMQAQVTFPGDTLPEQVDLYVDGTFWRTVHPLRPQTEIARTMDETAKASAEAIRANPALPNDPTDYPRLEGYSEGKQTGREMLSDRYLARVREHQAEITARTIPDDYMKNLTAPDGPNAEVFASIPRVDPTNPTAENPSSPPAHRFLSDDERLYVFISSSIPEATLRTYIQDAAKLNDPHIVFVLRGFVGGARKVAPTMDFVRRITFHDPACVPTDERTCEIYPFNLQIDPPLFRRYEITEVPAFVYAKGVEALSEDAADLSEGLSDNYTVSTATRLLGDVSLPYALETIAKETGAATLLAAADAIRHPARASEPAAPQ